MYYTSNRARGCVPENNKYYVHDDEVMNSMNKSGIPSKEEEEDLSFCIMQCNNPKQHCHHVLLSLSLSEFLEEMSSS